MAAFSPAGGLSWASYLGGTFEESANGVALGPDGAVFVAGYSESSAFPTTAGAFQPTKAQADDAFVLKIGGAATSPEPNPSPTPTPGPQPFKLNLPLIVQ